MPTLRKVWRATVGFLHERRTAYQLTFGSRAGQTVLKDLAKFCRANETCFAADERIHSAREGRREVWLRIQQHLNLSEADLYRLYGGIPVDPAQITERDSED